MHRRQTVAGLMVILALLLAAGCATETRLEPAPGTPQPSWVDSPPEASDGNHYYIGIGLAQNVLDEQSARRKARMNAAETIAQEISLDVQTLFRKRRATEGAAHKGEEIPREKIDEEVEARANEVVRSMTVKEFYTERWKVRESFMGKAFKRYKFYVLVSYPDSEYERLVEEVHRGVAE